MQFAEFIRKVSERSGIDEKEARRRTRAVLNTLGERLGKSLRDKLASEIPREMKEFVFGDWGERTNRFDLEDFYTRVVARAGIGYTAAVEETRCVLSLLKESIPRGVMHDISAELPDEFQELFGRMPASALSPTVSEKVCPSEEERK
ncbi:MAG: DUF2267 domain-containing protein [Syntrophaceae bacterium]